jgi:hypothetical protein
VTFIKVLTKYLSSTYPFHLGFLNNVVLEFVF